ncbi:uncharacterized protein N7515_005788 [Penicillium bovifimosum]|uniref:Uncharacterized protein n=1 Tax=Penicillium bovifimosum TaxID=126998 RepID=A0A9W9GTE5_9EURO|nr:uncharacterized protein N7515_005788 [Penicillium bovifimosum]KAJ5129749.1 hypothetical protein N7515_005788 [Penicillium bovifimosum]
MPRPARHDQLPRLTGLINWECLDSLVDGTDAELASTVEERSLPILGTDSLPLPRGILDAANSRKLSQDADQTQSSVQLLPGPLDAALEPCPLQYMGSCSDTVSPQGSSSDQSMSGRLQQCQHALQLLGFPSVDAFALEYYTARFGPRLRRSGVEQREGLSTVDRLAMLLQNESRVDAMDPGGLQRDIGKSARELYIAELRDFDHKLYDPHKAEHQVSEVLRLAVQYGWLIMGSNSCHKYITCYTIC